MDQKWAKKREQKKGKKNHAIFIHFFNSTGESLMFLGGCHQQKFKTKHAQKSPGLAPISSHGDVASDGLARTNWRSKTWAANLGLIYAWYMLSQKQRYPEKWCDKMNETSPFKMLPFLWDMLILGGLLIKDTSQWKPCPSSFTEGGLRSWNFLREVVRSWGHHEFFTNFLRWSTPTLELLVCV